MTDQALKVAKFTSNFAHSSGGLKFCFPSLFFFGSELFSMMTDRRRCCTSEEILQTGWRWARGKRRRCKLVFPSSRVLGEYVGWRGKINEMASVNACRRLTWCSGSASHVKFFEWSEVGNKRQIWHFRNRAGLW